MFVQHQNTIYTTSLDLTRNKHGYVLYRLRQFATSFLRLDKSGLDGLHNIRLVSHPFDFVYLLCNVIPSDKGRGLSFLLFDFIVFKNTIMLKFRFIYSR